MSQPNAGAPGPSTPGKAIASLAKKPADTTRAGTQKMKFVPTLPVRRKKEYVPQRSICPHPLMLEPQGRQTSQNLPPRQLLRLRHLSADADMVVGAVEAMARVVDAEAGASGWRSAPRVTAAPIVPRGPGGAAALGANLTKSAAPTLKKEHSERGVEVEDDVEVYSDPDEGVEIVDMKNVHTMDWMAPESLRWEGKRERKKKKAAKVKKEEEDEPALGKGKAKEEPMVIDGTPDAEDGADVDLANALDLSESEEEEEMEDIIEDFAQSAIADSEEPDLRQERLYFFQFPSPFPTFVSPTSSQPAAEAAPAAPEAQGKRVSFSEDTKPPASAPEDVDKEQPPVHVDGMIGQLEIYQSGAVKMRLANGILMDVTAATQPSFLQQAVHLDRTNKGLHVLGEVSRRFVVTPDVDSLLTAMAQADAEAAAPKLEVEGLLSMDTT
ncbi:RNA polymerase III RPC4-domain-containing protein [Gloeopeniophorella convolvens]|nr:RNA polymerase III RPC4-domain-containing protein [Gloeopeniophorella convolvens]